MNDEFKKISKEILKEIGQAKNILLHLHPRPDGDSVGSALGMYHVLRGMDKDVTIIAGDSPLPQHFSHLPGFSEIVQKNFFEINIEDFNLFIIQDSASTNLISNLQEVVFPGTLKKIVIDHHATNKNYGDINLVDPSFVAVSEMLFYLFKEWGIQITRDIGACLFIGIYTDSGGYRYSTTKERTFLAGAEIAKVTQDFSEVLRVVENSNPPDMIRYIGLALASTEISFNGKVAMSSVSHQVLLDNKIKKENTKSPNLNDILRSISGVEISMSLVEKEPNQVMVSLRSGDGEKFDVSKIAIKLEKSGGGHKAAAGAMIAANLEEAKKQIKEVISSIYEASL